MLFINHTIPEVKLQQELVRFQTRILSQSVAYQIVKTATNSKAWFGVFQNFGGMWRHFTMLAKKMPFVIFLYSMLDFPKFRKVLVPLRKFAFLNYIYQRFTNETGEPNLQ
jgi:hypothetical protein